MNGPLSTVQRGRLRWSHPQKYNYAVRAHQQRQLHRAKFLSCIFSQALFIFRWRAVCFLHLKKARESVSTTLREARKAKLRIARTGNTFHEGVGSLRVKWQRVQVGRGAARALL